jgi:hypothetical protein
MRKLKKIGLYLTIGLLILLAVIYAKSCVKDYFIEKEAKTEETKKYSRLMENSGIWQIMEKEFQTSPINSSEYDLKITIINEQGTRMKIIANYGKCLEYIDSLNLLKEDKIEFQYFESPYGSPSWKFCNQEWLNYTTIKLHKR